MPGKKSGTAEAVPLCVRLHHDPAVLEIDLQNQSGDVVTCIAIRVVVLQVD